MDLDRRTDPRLIAFLILSLLLHLLLLLLVPRQGVLPVPEAPRPVVVEMRPQPPRERELDQPERPDEPRTEPARRLGPSDQQVPRETAPEGRDFEDLTPSAPPARPRPPVPAVESPPPPRPAPEPPAAEPAAPSRPAAAPEAPAAAPQSPAATRPLPDIRTLMAATTQAAANVAEEQVREWRRKHREDVERGDAVWLDMERDLLNSFFRRFRDRIYLVWNYPQRAAERGEEGVCLLKITVRRDGTVKRVQLVESSGSALLDNEALAAVRRGAPYGDLPRAYPEDELTLFAFFQYHLTRRMARPGDIF